MDIIDDAIRALKALVSDDAKQRPKRKFEELSREENNVIGECSLKDKKKELCLGTLTRHVRGLKEEVSGLAREGTAVEVHKIASTLLSAPDLAGDTTAKMMMETIWTSLMDKSVFRIGVYGMGGIGKTTVMKHIYNRLLIERNKSFDNIIWVTLSRSARDIIELQRIIASKLSLDLYESEDVTTRARKLQATLEAKKRFLLILDDMWEGFSLEDFGIPKPTVKNGCKIVFTTRLVRVCQTMDFRPIKMVLLSEDEAWNLFKNHVGCNVLLVDNLEPIVKEVFGKCGRLPLAIVTMATCMKGEVRQCEWENARNELTSSSTVLNDRGMEKIYKELKFSYDRLKLREHQDCLLYCALYPEDWEIEEEELITRLIEEGIVKQKDTARMELTAGMCLLNTLVDACLLEHVTIHEKEYVKMHDCVRDMALQITSESPRFMVKANIGLKDLPEEWSEEFLKVSLMENHIEEISASVPPWCPIVSTLLLNNNPLKSIPASFFENMLNLKVLNLSSTNIKFLPSSVSNLVNLVALLLSNCLYLEWVPSLARLTQLRSLDLASTQVQQVPEGLEKLINLRYLNLGVSWPLEFPLGILPNLSRLRHLVVTATMKADELMKLKWLEIFYGFLDEDEFVAFMRHKDSAGRPTNYNLIVVPSRDLWANMGSFNISSMRSHHLCSISLENCNITSVRRSRKEPLVLPKDVQILNISSFNDATNLCDVKSFETIVNLREFRVIGCNGMTHLFSVSSSTLALQSLEFVDIKGMENLRAVIGRESIASSPLPPTSFSCLKQFQINDCPKIQELEIFSNFGNLERIEVISCENLQVITTLPSHDIGMESLILTLPKLRYFCLDHLPALLNICPNFDVVICNSLERIKVNNCPYLKRIPLRLCLENQAQLFPLPSLQEITVSQEQWKSLQCGPADAKKVLQPFCQFTDSLF